MLTLFITLSTLSTYSREGGKNPKYLSSDPSAIIVDIPKTKPTSLYLDFTYYNEPTLRPGVSMRPHNNQHNYSKSASSINTTNSNVYYCNVKVTAENFSKTYLWKAGTEMDVDAPTDRAYTLTVTYIEPQYCPAYSYAGSGRVSYEYRSQNTYWKVARTAKMKSKSYKTT